MTREEFKQKDSESVAKLRRLEEDNANLRAALHLHDGEIEAAVQSVKFPRGAEDKLLAKYELTWDALERFSEKTEWALSSKLASCLLDMGGLCEDLAEKAALYDLRERKIRAIEPAAPAGGE